MRYVVATIVLCALLALVAAELIVCLLEDLRRTKRWEKDVEERIERYERSEDSKH
jgi:hypothetical protein